MDPYDGSVLGKVGDKQWEPIYRALGQTRRFAERVNLAQMTPRNELSSTNYCLAAPGAEYLIYIPEGGSATVDLSASKGELDVEWFDPTQEKTSSAKPTQGGAKQKFQAPFDGPAVIYLKAKVSKL
jgi:hypothetical protein